MNPATSSEMPNPGIMRTRTGGLPAALSRRAVRQCTPLALIAMQTAGQLKLGASAPRCAITSILNLASPASASD